MKQFFKYVLATVVGVVLSAVLLFIVLIGIVTASLSSLSPGNSADVAVGANSILYIPLNHLITEKTEPSPFEGMNFPGISNVQSLGLNDILARIKAAKEDGNIKGIYLNLSSVDGGFATMRAIREALIDFKQADKFVVSYSDSYTQRAYYLSSAADEVYLNPAGSLDFRGLSSSVMFMKDALDKLGVDVQVIKVGTYKSAVEPFILNQMSDANRDQVQAYLGSIYEVFVADIAKNRNISEEQIKDAANRYLIQSAEDAVEHGFVDRLIYKDELIQLAKEKLGIDEKKDIPFVSLVDYKKTPSSGSAAADRVAVLYAYGDIVDGDASTGSIGGESLAREIRSLRQDDKVKAIVMRVNSPGGSALASEIIWREVNLTKEKKPFIVSMGDYAASGGYYISAAADSIFADPNTLTGSIGVFGLIPNFSRLLNDKLGIRFESVKTGEFADFSVDRPMTGEERTIAQNGVNLVYDTFLTRVAEGRKMSKDMVDSIGQGRVWSGAQALEINLVDRLATLDDAVKSAAAMAKIDTYRVMEYPREKDPFSSLFSTSKEKIKMWLVNDELGEYAQYLKRMKDVVKTKGVQARVPYQLDIY